MSRVDIAAVAIKILALYFFIQILAQAPSVLTTAALTFSSDLDFDSKLLMLSESLSLTIHLLAAGGLWKFAPRLANIMTADTPEAPSKPTENRLQNIEILCVSILGLLILAAALPALSKITFASILPHLDSSYPKTLVNPFTPEKKALIPLSDILFLFVKLAIGLWFTFGSIGVVGLIRRFREMGRAEKRQ